MENPNILGQQSTPPAAYNSQTLLDQVTAWKTAMLSAGLEMKLFNNNVIVTKLTTLADLVESVAPGYAPFAVSVLHGPYTDEAGNAYCVTDLGNFVCAGAGSDLIYGGYIVQGTGAAATVTFTEAGGQYTAPVVTSGGAGYQVAPRVTPTGATGSGAVLEAVITGGVVTAVNIINPGSGYTTATATIESPNKLVEVGNLPTPQPLQESTDAVQIIFQLDILAVA